MHILHFAEHMIHLTRDDVRHVGGIGPTLQEHIEQIKLFGAVGGGVLLQQRGETVQNLGTPYLIQPVLIPLIVIFGSWLLFTQYTICFPFYAGDETLAA